MKLLVVVPYYKPAFIYGGPARSVPNLCEGLAMQGVDVTVYTTNANGPKYLDVVPNIATDIDGVKLTYFRQVTRNSIFYSPSLADACKATAQHFDLVYVASTWGYPFIPACSAAHQCNTPYVISPRTAFMHETWRGKYIKKWIYHSLIEKNYINTATALHYTTELEYQESKWLKLNPRPFIVPNPVSSSEFANLSSRGLFRKKFGISTDAQVVLFLGRVDPRKGIDITLESFARVATNYPMAKLVIAGPEEDSYVQTLKQMSSQLKITDQVLFTDYLDSQSRLSALADADVFILTSYSENFGMAIVEAMYAGLPVVISDRVGIADEIKAGNAGVVVSLDIDAISVKLAQLLSSSQMRRDLGQKAKALAFKRYSVESVSMAMYKELTSLA